MGELARRRPSVDGDQGAAEDGDREIGEDPLGPVAHEEADLVAPAHTERVEALGEPAHRVAQFAIAKPRLAADQRLVVGVSIRQLVEQVRNGLRVGWPHVVDFATGIGRQRVVRAAVRENLRGPGGAWVEGVCRTALRPSRRRTARRGR